MGWLNIGSLVLGLLAWILPIVNLLQFKNKNHKYWLVLSLLSITACATSLCFQIFYQSHLVEIEDFSALQDTITSIASISRVLLTVTIVLNAVTLFVYRNKLTR